MDLVGGDPGEVLVLRAGRGVAERGRSLERVLEEVHGCGGQ